MLDAAKNYLPRRYKDTIRVPQTSIYIDAGAGCSPTISFTCCVDLYAASNDGFGDIVATRDEATI